MSNCCDKNPLQRNGINQSQRLLAGLKPGYILIDEREYADWIFFADEFSRYLKYYNTTGAVAGDWKPFFNNDISAILGSIAVQEVETYRRSIKERFDFIRDNDNAGNIVVIKQKLNELFAAILTLSKALDDYLLKLPDKDQDGKNDFVFKSTLINLVQTKLSPALRRLLSYYFAVDGVPAGTTDYLENSDMTGWKALNRQVINAEVIINVDGLSNNWWSSGEADWSTYIATIDPDEIVFGPAVWIAYRRINHAANHNLFSSIFDQYLQVYARMVQEAEKALLATLENWDAHPAHYALFLSFLKLFRFARSDVNGLTQKHLDFYYKDILRLKPKETRPNHAHILVELAKQTDAYALKQGAECKAGKDSDGKEIIYALDKEETFNKAKLVFLKSFYKGDKDGKDDQLAVGTTTIEVNNKGRVFASPVANSNDGKGAGLKSANKEWHPFVNKKFEEGRLVDIAMPNALIGFAIASHYLYLAEGKRRVYIRLATTSANISLLHSLSVDCYLTTEKEWYKIPSVPFTTATMNDTTACAQLTFLIPGNAPAVTNYNAAVHGGSFKVSLPVLKVYLKNEDGTNQYRYNDFSAVTITKTEIKVEAGMETGGYNQEGLKQLLLSNDFGPLDAAKPFTPFGSQPKKDATFVIGNKEAFNKKNAALKLNIEWANLPSDPRAIDFYADPPYTVASKVNFLNSGIWKSHSDDSTIVASEQLFNGSTPKVNVFATPQPIPELSVVPYTKEYTSYNAASGTGFMRFVLGHDFGHKAFQDAMTAYLIAQSRTPPSGTKPTEPYTPTIQSLYLSYSAHSIQSQIDTDKNNFDRREIRFFHIYPFGEAEQHACLLDSTEIFLFPQFTHTKEGTRIDHIGEFYIGIEKLKEQQSVNILFQLLEGSSDPLVVKPDEHIQWSYLSKNQWKNFDDRQISDATRQLVQSGIISFIIPEGATTGNTILPVDYLWLRAAVSEAAGAVCKLITADAQASVVSFEPRGNAENFLDTALPAGSISKLKTPSSSVKKIVQPYSSFGGRSKESNESFYVRVSERLRHKARAITIWDYEHLVLEAFPGLHKVKCLNHTKFEKNKDTGEVEYNEVAPGYVTVITIPDLINRNDTNPLRPYTNQNILLEVEEYLKKKISCHVKLRVKNPRFEEIWLSFKLRLVKGFDDFTFYAAQLKEEITRFLTPWAYGSGSDIQFGGKIHKSTLINFIEERPYVDFITDVKMYHDSNPDHEDAGKCGDEMNQPPGASADLEIVEASTARSIIVSVPASRHVITELPEPGVEEKGECADQAITTTTTDGTVIL